MMNKHHISAISVALAFVVICGTLFFVSNLDKTEKRTNLFSHYYSFEPDSLLDALDRGRFNVFSKITGEPSPNPSLKQTPVPWTQNNYLRIANALFEYAIGDTLDGWQLNSMNFSLGCDEFGVGFQEGNFKFFKYAKTSERESRIQLIINIRPRSKYVFITENEYYPKLVNWSSIDLEQNQLFADDILQIADNVGGQVKRLSVENACDISLLLSPDSASYNGWSVSYYRQDDRTTFFHIEIDPITGKIRSR